MQEIATIIINSITNNIGKITSTYTLHNYYILTIKNIIIEIFIFDIPLIKIYHISPRGIRALLSEIHYNPLHDNPQILGTQ
jgi:hypothetical protein